MVKGAGAAIGLLSIYFVVVSMISGWAFAKSEFFANWPWIIGLTIGFGVQVTLFAYLRSLPCEHMSGVVVATSGTISGSSMLACCAHYLVNVISIVGISGLVALVGQYQQELFAVSAVFNGVGVVYMARQLIRVKKNNKICHE